LVLKINGNEGKSCAGAWGGVSAIFSFYFPFFSPTGYSGYCIQIIDNSLHSVQTLRNKKE